jgi:sterol desaturase/sphingolipid hydroxylase (fatty acid hydroxylase superfamily)
MPEPTRKTFAEHLVAQDPPLSEEKFREHRMQLEKALTDASRRESRVRMTVLILWLLCLIIPMAAVGLANGWRVQVLPWYPLLQYLLLIVTIVETVSYFVRFLPARLRAGSALNRNILLDLDRRITDLTNRIDQTTKENRPGETP